MISCTDGMDIVRRKGKVSLLIDFTVEILEYPLAWTLSDTLIFVLWRFVNDINWLVKSFYMRLILHFPPE